MPGYGLIAKTVATGCSCPAIRLSACPGRCHAPAPQDCFGYLNSAAVEPGAETRTADSRGELSPLEGHADASLLRLLGERRLLACLASVFCHPRAMAAAGAGAAPLLQAVHRFVLVLLGTGYEVVYGVDFAAHLQS